MTVSIPIPPPSVRSARNETEPGNPGGLPPDPVRVLAISGRLRAGSTLKALRIVLSGAEAADPALQARLLDLGKTLARFAAIHAGATPESMEKKA